MFTVSDADGTGRMKKCTVHILTGTGAIRENTGRVKRMRLIDADKLCEDLLERWGVADTRKEELIRQVMADIVTPIIASQPTIENKQNWTPCSEKMPKESDDYIVSGKWSSGKVAVGDCEFNKDDGYFRTQWNFDVLAWMPFPEPYKEVER